MPSDLTGGVEYNQDNLKDDMWGYNRYTNQKVRIAGAFSRMNGETGSGAFFWVDALINTI